VAAENSPLSDVLKLQYRLRFDGARAYRNSVWKVLCNAFFSRFLPKAATILDLGAGWGEFINNVEAGTKYAMDLNPDTGANLEPGITFIQQDCSQPWDVGTESLDAVFTSNFLEHLYDKASIERTIAEAYRCLKQGGVFICMGPNIKYVPGEYWDFWDHQIPLTEQSCGELLRMKGFTVAQCISRFLPYSMSGGRKYPLFFIRLYLMIPLIWPLLGKQFLVIAYKKTTIGS
jgi:SAM-dependent methyltransferase